MVYSQHFHKNGSTSDILKYKIYSISDWICKDMAIRNLSHIGGMFADVIAIACLRFSSLAYHLTRRSRGRIYKVNAKTERAD